MVNKGEAAVGKCSKGCNLELRVSELYARTQEIKAATWGCKTAPKAPANNGDSWWCVKLWALSQKWHRLQRPVTTIEIIFLTSKNTLVERSIKTACRYQPQGIQNMSAVQCVHLLQQKKVTEPSILLITLVTQTNYALAWNCTCT